MEAGEGREGERQKRWHLKLIEGLALELIVQPAQIGHNWIFIRLPSRSFCEFVAPHAPTTLTCSLQASTYRQPRSPMMFLSENPRPISASPPPCARCSSTLVPSSYQTATSGDPYVI
jgi:hypothetical protein